MVELNKIYNEDCFEGMKQIPDGSIPLIIADPPYMIPNIHGGNNHIKGMNESFAKLREVNDITDGYSMERLAEEVSRLQGDNINAYFWCNKLQIPDYFRIYVNEMECKFDIICWHKMNAMPTYSNKYLSDTEYCLYFHKGKGNMHPQSYEEAKTYFLGNINSTDKKHYDHPTIKPLNYIRTLIRNSSNEGDLVLDPFMGSGTTAIACIEEGRQFVGFEISKEYFDISQKRLKDRLSQYTLW